MNYPKSMKYDTPELMSKIMGPNPFKLQEELLKDHRIPDGATVCDLGSGQGLTSVMLVKEYGFKVYAVDLWSEPHENRRFFFEMGLTLDQITPIKADAAALPFDKDFFDAIVSTDSYNYWGRNPEYLDAKLLPYLKPGGYLHVCVPGMKKDLHDNLPEELLLSWTPDQLSYLRDAAYWTDIVSRSHDAELVDLYEMEGNEDLWKDWLNQENEIAVNDRKAMDAGAGAYLNFIAFVLRKK